MKNTDRRGQFVARFFYPLVGAARRVTRWHYVDSEVADRAVTYCGREMKTKLRSGRLDFAAGLAEGESLCESCGEGSLGS